MRFAQLARHLEAIAKNAVVPVATAKVLALSEAYQTVSSVAQGRLMSREPV
jgi:hypothetical protein